ncbi:energy transducer TonB [Lacibacter luteus]|nr:energy transducer TonB [Lacibacter luteus]
MKSEEILKADVLDILFENRNKAYGAYSIRKAYPSHLKKAMATMLLLVGAGFVIVMSQSKKADVRFTAREKITEVVLDPYVEREKPKEQPKPQERTVAEKPPTKIDTDPEIVPDDQAKNLPPDRTDPAIYNPGPIDDPGTPGGGDYIQAKQGNETVITPDNTKEKQPEAPQILEISEIAPEFPGGMQAWISYLQKMLRVPDDLEAGDRKTVRVKFVVNANGDVTDAVIVASGGNQFDREVLRVIGRMPKWKPGKQNGKAVAVYFTQPVTFTAPEE